MRSACQLAVATVVLGLRVSAVAQETNLLNGTPGGDSAATPWRPLRLLIRASACAC